MSSRPGRKVSATTAWPGKRSARSRGPGEGRLARGADGIALQSERGVFAGGLQDPRPGDAVEQVGTVRVEPAAGRHRQALGGEQRPGGQLVRGRPEDRGRRAGEGNAHQLQRRGGVRLDVRHPGRRFDQVEDDQSQDPERGGARVSSPARRRHLVRDPERRSDRRRPAPPGRGRPRSRGRPPRPPDCGG